MTNALMLIFALSAAGESGTLAIAFESMQKCEEAKFEAVKVVSSASSPNNAPITYIALACVKPVQVKTL